MGCLGGFRQVGGLNYVEQGILCCAAPLRAATHTSVEL